MIGHRRILPALVLGLAACGLLVATQGGASAADVDTSKLVGTWVLTKVNGMEPPNPLAFELTKKGKVVYALGNLKTEGSYEVDGNKLTIRMSAPKVEGKTRGKDRTIVSTILKLTDDVLVTKSERGGESEFRKKK